LNPNPDLFELKFGASRLLLSRGTFTRCLGILRPFVLKLPRVRDRQTCG